MKHLEQYYRNLSEQLEQQIAILEAKLKDKKKAKKEKLADKDYDKDGELETSKEEHKGAVDNAIKKALAKKKGVIKEGREFSTGNIVYGGFPRVLKESQATYIDPIQPNPNQGVSIPAVPSNLAPMDTNSNGVNDSIEGIDLYVKGGMGLRYPSASYAALGHKAYDLGTAATEARKTGNAQKAKELAIQRHNIMKQMQAHPHHAQFMSTAERHESDVRGGNFGE